MINANVIIVSFNPFICRKFLPMSRNIALTLLTLAAVIYGVTFTFAKDVMPVHIKPFGFIVLRVAGATILFWITGLFIKSEKIIGKDFIRIFFAALFGVALNMLCFFKGLSLTTPINAASIMVMTPILVFILAIIILKEKLSIRKGAGVLIGLLGAIVLIFYKQQVSSGGENIRFGNFLVLVNAVSYALYFIIVKKLLQKYNPFTFVKWMYLIAFILVLPFGYNELMEVDFTNIPTTGLFKISFIIVCTTYLTYMFNILGLTTLKPTTVSVFIYFQPIIASAHALLVGSDSLDGLKIGATAVIFIGVYLVTQPPLKERIKRKHPLAPKDLNK